MALRVRRRPRVRSGPRESRYTPPATSRAPARAPMCAPVCASSKNRCDRADRSGSASTFFEHSKRAGDRTRTGDVQLGKLAFYQLNYAREVLPLQPTRPRPREPAVGIEPTTARLRIECSTTELRWRPHDPARRLGSGVPWRGLEPRRLTAPPPQDGVSTNFTTRAFDARAETPRDLRFSTGLTGLEPATSGVTDRHSNQLSYSPNDCYVLAPNGPNGNRTRLCTLKECRPNR